MSTNSPADIKLSNESGPYALAYIDCLVDNLYKSVRSNNVDAVDRILRVCVSEFTLEELSKALEIAASKGTPETLIKITELCDYKLDSKAYENALVAATSNPEKVGMLTTLIYATDKKFCGKDLATTYINHGKGDQITAELINKECTDGIMDIVGGITVAVVLSLGAAGLYYSMGQCKPPVARAHDAGEASDREAHADAHYAPLPAGEVGGADTAGEAWQA